MTTITTAMPQPYAFRPEQLKRLRELGCAPFASNGRAAALRVSVAVYEQLIEEGVLGEDDRCELLDGEVVGKMPIGSPHAGCIDDLNELLGDRLRGRARVRIQNPIKLLTSEPEPDVCVAMPGSYRTAHPMPADVLLVIEVAESSLERDRDIKGPLYAAGGIIEYWIVDLNSEQVQVYRDPRPDGTWGWEQIYGRGEGVELSAMAGVCIGVDAIFGEPPA